MLLLRELAFDSPDMEGPKPPLPPERHLHATHYSAEAVVCLFPAGH